jgi:hypothetical protein
MRVKMVSLEAIAGGAIVYGEGVWVNFINCLFLVIFGVNDINLRIYIHSGMLQEDL